jgi:hypothetical protein
MSRLMLLLAMYCALALPATAQSPVYPKDVQAVLDRAAKFCLDEGGTPAEFSAEDVHKVDLNGDGRDDYIVHLQNATCPGSLGAFCGTGGCDLEILIANRNGSYKSIFGQRVRGYEIKPGRGARTIRFQLHGTYCGGHGNPSCYKTRRITGKTFALKEPQSQ